MYFIISSLKVKGGIKMSKIFVICALVLLPYLGYAQIAEYNVKEKSGTTLLLVSTGTLVGVYAGTIIADAIGGGKIDFPEIFIPAIGPIIAVFRYDSYVRDDWPNQGLEKTLFAISGIVQTASIVGIGIGAGRIKVNKKNNKGSTSYLYIKPVGGGIRATYNF
jgi:hypothetical protein